MSILFENNSRNYILVSVCVIKKLVTKHLKKYKVKIKELKTV